MQGRAFLGEQQQPARTVAFAARDRVDEEIEMSSTAFDGRWQYIRNYMAHRPVLQHGDYSEVGDVWKELRRLDAAGELEGDKAYLMQPTKPQEELYDLENDPWQLNNLAGSAEHATHRDRLRREMHAWMTEIRDTGLLPEAEMRARAGDGSPRDIDWPVEPVLAAAEGEARPDDPDAASRYWTANALLNGGYSEEVALKLAEDESVSVRIVACEALCRNGQSPKGLAGLEAALASDDACVQLAAISALWHLGPLAARAVDSIRRAMETKTEPEYQRTYFEWAAAKIIESFV
jgi:hypothetical protein